MNKTNQPLVSVLMTVYNREAFIAEAIESVLESDYPNFELIIVDDCSKDNSVAIAKKYAEQDDRVKVYVNETNLGDYPNRNQAAAYAKGKYIKYLDADDIMYPHCLPVMVRSMETFPDAGFGLCAIFPDPKTTYPVMLNSHDTYMEHFNGYAHFHRAPGSSIILKEAFDKVGRFSGERMIGDTDLWFRIAMYYPMVKVSSHLYWDRTHDDQERSSDYAKKEYPRLRKMVLERYFNHKDCPLSKEEIEQINKNKKRLDQKNMLLSVVKKMLLR